MTYKNHKHSRLVANRMVTVAALLLMLGGALLLPAAAVAQDTVPPLPVDEPPPAAVPMSALPLPLVPEPETEADIVPLESPETFVASPEALAATQPIAYMPLVSKDHALIQADRMGFGAGVKLSSVFDVRGLYAGWYVNWSVKVTPERPANMEFMQMVRVHQDLVDGCAIGTTADRKLCPYKTPYSYTYAPSDAVIKAAAKANPGSVWLIGNEMDRMDWSGGRQDEIVPELYAVAYHNIRAVIKAADPTARIAIGGVIQYTPLRKEYLDRVWDTYKSTYREDMPVDVWNIHNFVGSEYCRREKVNGVSTRVCYGMGIPAGVVVTPNSKGEEIGAYVGEDWRHVDMMTFKEQITGFRTWMKNHGQMNKPLIITEYGVLYKSLCIFDDPKKVQECIASYGAKYVDLTNPTIVHNFMIDTFNYFMTAKDDKLSGVDGNRLVQRWAWYSLEEAGWGFNPYGALYNAALTQRSTAGELYRAFSAKHESELQYP